MKQGLLFIFFFTIGLFGFAQLDAGEDIVICKGEVAQLNASGGSNYLWTSIPNDPTLSNPYISNPTVQPDTTTTYVVMAREVGNNTIGNGDFEEGNSGFLSDYTYNPTTIWDPGTYAIVDDANTVHPHFSCDEDHTTGDGLMMCINGASIPNEKVWTKSIPFIAPDTEYEFSTWISSLSPDNPARLQFSINGVLLGQPFQATSTTCQWNQFFELWDSGSATSATISIVNQNTASGGNDFSLDDISFAVVQYVYDTVVVHVLDEPTSSFDVTQDICSIDTATIYYTGNAPDTSDYHWDFDGGVIVSGSGQGPYKVHWTDAGVKNIGLWVEHACASDTTSHPITVHETPTASISADELSIPQGTNTTLHGSMTGQPGPMDFTWSPANKLVDPGSLDPVTELLYASTEFTFEVVDQSSNCKASDTIVIEVTGDALAIALLTVSPDSICVGEDAELQLTVHGGSGNYEASWYSDPPGFLHAGPEMIIPVSPGESTTYYVTVSDGFTTTPPDSVKLVVRPQISIISQPTDNSTAPHQMIFFEVTAVNNSSFQWQVSLDGGATWEDLVDGPEISGSTTPTLTVGPTTLEMNGWEFRCLLLGFCDPVLSETGRLQVSEAPTMISAIEADEVCEADTFSLSYQVTNFIQITDYQIMLNYDENIVEFMDLENVTAELQSDLLVKKNEGSITVSWSSNTPVSLNTDFPFDFQFAALSGGYTTLEWEEQQCFAVNESGYDAPMNFSDSEITVNALPVTPDFAYTDKDTLSILDEVDILLTAEGGSGDLVIWSGEDCDGDYVGEGNPLEIFRPEETTTYYAKWETVCGMSDCKEVQIVITQEFDVYAPNAFSPNDDGLNDSFQLVSANDLHSFRMLIFDRWGQQVFESSDVFEGWDGTINGSPAGRGTYVWKATYQFRREGSGSESIVQSGTVNLVR